MRSKTWIWLIAVVVVAGIVVTMSSILPSTWLLSDKQFVRTVWAQVIDKLLLGGLVGLFGYMAAERFERYKSRQALRLELAKSRIKRIDELVSPLMEVRRLLIEWAENLEIERELQAEKSAAMLRGRMPLELDFKIVRHQERSHEHLNEVLVATDRLHEALRQHVGLLNEPVLANIHDAVEQTQLATSAGVALTEGRGDLEEVVRLVESIQVPGAEQLVELLAVDSRTW